MQRVDTFETMGTVVSLRHPGSAPLAEIRAVFEAWDARYSLYRADSEASAIARGELTPVDASPAFRQAYAESLDWRIATSGAFTPHRPDGVIDLSGTVKARAMSEAAPLLDDSGDAGWLMAAGGDVCGRGDDAGAPWRVGIVDPDDRHRLVSSVALDAGGEAVATSGVAERGEHVWRIPSDGTPFTQVTVVADDIVLADVMATAILSGGRSSLDDVVDRFDIDVLAFDADGMMLATPGMRTRLRTPA
jgi:thiamine biosynthesis lipoprotein